MVRNKEKDLDKAVWVNQVVLFLQPLFYDCATSVSEMQYKLVPLSSIF